MAIQWKEILLQNFDTDNVCLSNFWNGIKVWIERPHIINRKLLAVEEVATFGVICAQEFQDFNYIVTKLLNSLKKDDIDVFSVDAIAMSLTKDLNLHLQRNDCKTECPLIDYINKSDIRLILQFRKLLPKNLKKFKDVMEIVIIDKVSHSVIFCSRKVDVQLSPITQPFPYRIKYLNNWLSLDIDAEFHINCLEQPSARQLKINVLPKVARWCQTMQTNIIPSLSLVPIKCYSEIYHYLKIKYGKKLVENWPECTDPLKYVFEDIAIAAYLMSLWAEERVQLNLKKKQTFVDLGCGNGLLVHILSSEGFKGLGIDIRRRKIWNIYGPETELIERTLEPSDSVLFPDYDWIIGNHSDELTPWIPVIAARSSYKMRIFLLPCCYYTFNGKYERTNSGSTRYQSYLSFIHDLCMAMGFNVQKDKLRIPSTKRICFVCFSRNYKETEEADVDILRSKYIVSFSKKYSNMIKPSAESFVSHENKQQWTGSCPERTIDSIEINKNWIADFKPRLKSNISNCSTFDAAFVHKTLMKVFNSLLESENLISLNLNGQTIFWNSGGQKSIKNVIQLLDQESLNCLKNQNGGLQTLLRNHRNIFEVHRGIVKLTVPSVCRKFEESERRKNHWNKRKKTFHNKKCFFYFYHPQSCPLSDENCVFSHNA